MFRDECNLDEYQEIRDRESCIIVLVLGAGMAVGREAPDYMSAYEWWILGK